MSYPNRDKYVSALIAWRDSDKATRGVKPRVYDYCTVDQMEEMLRKKESFLSSFERGPEPTPESSLRAGPEAVAISLAIGRHLKPGYLVEVDVPGHGAWTVTRERDGTYSATQSRLRATLREVAG
jgi:hypothetical protein